MKIGAYVSNALEDGQELLRDALIVQTITHRCNSEGLHHENCRSENKMHKVQEVVTSESIVLLLEESLRLLAPIDTLIVSYQLDAILLLEVVQNFMLFQLIYTACEIPLRERRRG